MYSRVRGVGGWLLDLIADDIPQEVPQEEQALAHYFVDYAIELERGDITREDAWFRILKDHPYVGTKDLEELLRDEYCVECGGAITTEPEGSTLCSDCMFGPSSIDTLDEVGEDA